MERVRIEGKPKIERVRLLHKQKRQRKEPNRMVFTEQRVKTLPPKKKQYMVWDGGNGPGARDVVRGLAVLVSPAGAKSYRSYYYFPGSHKPHSRTLDRVGVMTLDDARGLCKHDQRLAKQGIDPKATDPSKSDTYAAAVEEYISREQIGRQGNTLTTANEARRVLLKLSLPTRKHKKQEQHHEWHGLPVATILPTQIQKELELLRDGRVDVKRPENNLKPRPYLANSLHHRLCGFFAWCARPTIGKIKSSPMAGIEKPWNGAKRRDREWFKGKSADNAIQALWRAADEIGAVEGAYLKLLLLTGKRKSALANMLWQEMDDDWFWNAPRPIAKNKRLHGIPLPVLAQRILHPRKERGFIFPGDDEGHIYVNGSWLQTKIIRASGIKDFFCHGVRHLAETKLAELKIAPHIRDLLFDHVPARGSGAGYDHHHYKDEMRAALEEWSTYIERLVQPEGAALLR